MRVHYNHFVWNNLPPSVRHTDSSSSFKTAIKIYPPFPKLFLTCQSFPQPFLSLWSVSGVCVCVWGGGGGVSVAITTVKCPVLPLYVEDGRCRNFLDYYYSVTRTSYLGLIC